MPSPAHESAVSELRAHPALLSTLLRSVLDAELDPHLEIEDSTVRFADPAEVRPDLVFLGRGHRWAVVEVQNEIDLDKRRRWLLAASMLFNDHEEMGNVVVITASRRVARWAGTVASVQSPLGTVLKLRPVVLLLAGAAVEALLDPAQPELALFAAWAMHSRHGPRAREIVRRAIDLTGTLPEPLRAAQLRAIFNMLNTPMMTFVREVLMDPKTTYESPCFREFRLELEARGEARGKAEGEARGKAEGEARGRAEGKAEALLVLLSTRELLVSTAQRERIQECTDLGLMDEWIRRATSASSVDKVLGPLARSPRRAPAKQASPATRRQASRA